jgi:hypothetical protein
LPSPSNLLLIEFPVSPAVTFDAPMTRCDCLAAATDGHAPANRRAPFLCHRSAPTTDPNTPRRRRTTARLAGTRCRGRASARERGRECAGDCPTRTQNGAILRPALANDEEAMPSRVAHAGELSAGLLPEACERSVAWLRLNTET